MTTDQCIHAMNLLARYMDVCNSLSDFPNATIKEIADCIHALEDASDSIIKSCYESLDTLEMFGG